MSHTRTAAVRRAFGRAAAGYDAHAFLQQEVARRLAVHLDEIKLSPRRILDAGCGTGFAAPLLRARYPRADLIGLDVAEGMAAEMRRRHGLLGWRWWLARLRPAAPSLSVICGDMQQLPLARGSVEMVWSSLSLQWVDLIPAFAECRRVLAPEGLLLFATLGPDTLKELRAASTEIDGYTHVNRFVDMHDVGDALVRAGFAHPVMEMEHLTLTYPDLRGVLADLKGIGGQTVLSGRRSGLMGKSAWTRLAANYEAFRREDGRLPATYEVVYGHAWAAAPSQVADGRQIMRFVPRGAGQGG